MSHLYTYVALDIAHDRAREADCARRARLALADRPRRPGVVRRGLATAFTTVSRGSAGIADRLSGSTTDELRQAMAHGK